MKYCPDCGEKLESDDEFCPGCGTKIKEAKEEKHQKEHKEEKEHQKTEKKHDSSSIRPSKKFFQILLILVLGLGVAAAFIYFVPVPYTMTEVYSESVPYETQEAYTEREPYSEQEVYYETEYYWDEECNEINYKYEEAFYEFTYSGDLLIYSKKVTNLESRSGDFVFKGVLTYEGNDWKTYGPYYNTIGPRDQKILTARFEGTKGVATDKIRGYMTITPPSKTECGNVKKERSVPKTHSVTKYRDVTKTRTVTKYKDVEKEKTVRKKATLYELRTEKVKWWPFT